MFQKKIESLDSFYCLFISPVFSISALHSAYPEHIRYVIHIVNVFLVYLSNPQYC